MNCLFCAIAAGEIPSAKVYEDEQVYAFKDIAPQGPVHVLIIPKKHIDSMQAAGPEDDGLLCQMLAAARQIARELGLTERAVEGRLYRIKARLRQRMGGERP